MHGLDGRSALSASQDELQDFSRGERAPEVFDLEGIERITGMFQQSDMESFEVEVQGARLKMSKNSASNQAVLDALMSALEVVSAARPAAAPFVPLAPSAPAPSQATAVSSSVSASGSGHPAQDAGDDSSATRVVSPLVGIFYAAPSPDDEPFVRVGDQVKKGQPLCIIEAMKVMNEIPSPCDGTVRAVVPANGAIVAFGDNLALIEA